MELTDEEIENNRKEAAFALGEDGFDVPAYAPGTMGYHEAFHTTFLTLDLVASLLEYPAIINDPELYKQIHKVHDQLFAAYNNMSSQHLLDSDTGEIK